MTESWEWAEREDSSCSHDRWPGSGEQPRPPPHDSPTGGSDGASRLCHHPCQQMGKGPPLPGAHKPPRNNPVGVRYSSPCSAGPSYVSSPHWASGDPQHRRPAAMCRAVTAVRRCQAVTQCPCSKLTLRLTTRSIQMTSHTPCPCQHQGAQLATA